MKALKTFLFAWAFLLLTIFMLPALLAQAATPLKYGQAANGTLDPAHPKVAYTFNGKTGEKLTIALNTIGGDIDPLVDLYDPQGKLIGEDDNGGGKDNALLRGVVLPTDGTYQVVAVNKRQGATGKYSLFINPAIIQGAAVYFEGPQPKEAYQLSRPWDHTTITYRIENTLPNFSAQDIRTIIQRAFQSWANVVPLTFQEVTSGRTDLDIKFAPIDGPLNILGETCPPSSPCAGQIQFDSEEPWVLTQPNGYQDISFLAVASHEFGHAIGLLHSSDASALMYPSYSPYNLKPGPDDIAGAQRLYGAGATHGNPPTQAPQAPSNPGHPQVRGTIDNSRFVTFWDFDVDAGETVTITMKKVSGNLDSFLVLVDANDHILAYSDDDGSSRDSVLRNIRLPQRGTYSVAATRFQQAQGFTAGDYTLTIDYGGTSAAQPAATTVSNAGQTGAVKVSAGQANSLTQNPSLDTVLDKAFDDSPTPQSQTRNATVQGNQAYSWDATWCARDSATLNKNLPDIGVSFAVNGQPVDSKLVTRTSPHNGPNGLSCVEFFVVLSDWSAGQVSLTKTLTLRKPVFDGMTIYAPGDYVYNYTVNVG